MPRAFPIRVAAIDIGSNAIRYMAASFLNEDHGEILEQVRLPLRLGHDVFSSGELTRESMEAAIAALASFHARMARLDVQRRRAVATSAVRDARNGAELVAGARAGAGIDIEIIDGAEEARLVHLAVRNRIALGDRQWLIADLGGGSLEISIVDAAHIFATESYAIGSVRLLETATGAADDPASFRARIAEFTAVLRGSRILNARVAGCIATGGNIEALARMAAAPSGALGVATLTTAHLRDLIDRLAELSYQERVTELALRRDRADVILPAAMVYEHLAMLAGADALLVPNVGVKDGVVLDLAARD